VRYFRRLAAFAGSGHSIGMEVTATTVRERPYSVIAPELPSKEISDELRPKELAKLVELLNERNKDL